MALLFSFVHDGFDGLRCGCQFLAVVVVSLQSCTRPFSVVEALLPFSHQLSVAPRPCAVSLPAHYLPCVLTELSLSGIFSCAVFMPSAAFAAFSALVAAEDAASLCDGRALQRQRIHPAQSLMPVPVFCLTRKTLRIITGGYGCCTSCAVCCALPAALSA